MAGIERLEANVSTSWNITAGSIVIRRQFVYQQAHFGVAGLESGL